MAVVEDVVVLRGVNFAFDKYDLTPEAQASLNEAARIIMEHPNMKVQLLGWTDSIGTDAYNLKLSQRRADAVKNYLVAQGVPAAYDCHWARASLSRYDNNTEEGRYMNRRTELVFMDSIRKQTINKGPADSRRAFCAQRTFPQLQLIKKSACSLWFFRPP